jgi:hypothetical protein
MLSKEQIQRVVAAVQAGDSVGVCGSLGAPGVTVPNHVPPWAVLWFGAHCTIPIPDLVCNSAGIGGTLHWRSHGYGYCYIPWRAVTVAEGTGWVVQGVSRAPDSHDSESWVASLVSAVKGVLGAEREDTGTHKLPECIRPGIPHLRLIRGGRK